VCAEGIAQRESDLNIVYLYGYGFPRKSGGPMHWARHVRPGGLPKVVDDLNAYAGMGGRTGHKKTALPRPCLACLFKGTLFACVCAGHLLFVLTITRR